MIRFFDFPKRLYLTNDYWLTDKLGSQSHHQVVLEFVERIDDEEKLNEYLTCFKLTGEIEKTNSVLHSEIGRELMIRKNTTSESVYPYSHTYTDYRLELGRIAIYRCIALNEKNPARKEINRKTRETKKKCKEITQKSKIISWMNAKEVSINKKVIWDLVKDELKPLNVTMNDIRFEVANSQKEEKNG